MLPIVLSSVSCKTTQTTIESGRKAETKTENRTATASARNTVSASDVRTTGKSRSTENYEETATEILWSTPDSAGRQYPVKTTQTTRRSVADKSESISQTGASRTEVAETASAASQTETDFSETAESVEESNVRTATPSWVNWLLLLLVAAAAAVVFAILRRWRII